MWREDGIENVILADDHDGGTLRERGIAEIWSVQFVPEAVRERERERERIAYLTIAWVNRRPHQQNGLVTGPLGADFALRSLLLNSL